MMKKKNNAGIIRLEERVLFEAAAAPEVMALAGMNEVGENTEAANQDIDDQSEEAGNGSENGNTVQQSAVLNKDAVQESMEDVPESVAFAEGSVVRESGETAEGLESAADNDGADEGEPLTEGTPGMDLDGEEADTAAKLLAAGSDAEEGKVELDLSDPASVIIDNGEEIDITVDGGMAGSAVTASAEEIASEINSNSVAVSGAPEEDKHELVIINSSTKDIDILVEEAGEGRDVLILDTTSEDPMADIAEYMEGKEYKYDAVHIVTHGSSKGIEFGSRQIVDGEYFAPMGEYLAEDADLMIYGCNTASTEEGQAFLQEIADATGADIAASVDPTGSAEIGGDWDLEYTIGEIAVDPVTVSNSWEHSLYPVYTITLDGKTAGPTGGGAGTYIDLKDFWDKNPLRLDGYLYEGDEIILKDDIEERYTGPIIVEDNALVDTVVEFKTDGKSWKYTIDNTSSEHTIYVGDPSTGAPDTEAGLKLSQDVTVKGTIGVGSNDFIVMENAAVEGTLGLGDDAELRGTDAGVTTLNVSGDVAYIQLNRLDIAGDLVNNSVSANSFLHIQGGIITVSGSVNYAQGENNTGTLILYDNTSFSGAGETGTLQLGNVSGPGDNVTIRGEVLKVYDEVVLEDGDTLTLNNGGIEGIVLFHGDIEGSGSISTLRVMDSGNRAIFGGTLSVRALEKDPSAPSVEFTIGATGTTSKLEVLNEIDFKADTVHLQGGGILAASGTLKTLSVINNGALSSGELTVLDEVNVAATQTLSLDDGAILHGEVNLEGTIGGNGGMLDKLEVLTTGNRRITNTGLIVNTLDSSSGAVNLTVAANGSLEVRTDFDFKDDTITLVNGTLSGVGTLKSLAFGTGSGTLRDGNLKVTDPINVAAGSTLYIQGDAVLQSGSLTNEGAIRGKGTNAVLNFTGNLTNNANAMISENVALRLTGNLVNNSMGGTAPGVGTVFSVTGDVTNSGTIGDIRSVTGNVINNAASVINSLGQVTGNINNAGTIGQLYNVLNDPQKNVKNTGTITNLLITVTGENTATGLTCTTVNEAFPLLASHGMGGTVSNVGVAISLNPYTYSDNVSFRTQNDVVTAEEALTLTSSFALSTATVFTSQPSALSTVEGYSSNNAATLNNLIIGDGVTLTLNDTGKANDYQFNNVGIQVAAGGTLDVTRGTDLVFSGNGAAAKYIFLSGDAYTMNGPVAYEGVSITNAGTVNITEGHVIFNRDNEVSRFSDIKRYNTYGIKNLGENASLSIVNSDIDFNLGSALTQVNNKAGDVYALWNVKGSVYIKDSDINLNTFRSAVDDGVKSIVIFNESNHKSNAVSGNVMGNLSESDPLADANVVVDDGRISLKGGDEEVYTVMNNGSMYFENSWVFAEGRKDVLGIKNDTYGVMEYHVTGDDFANYDTLDAYLQGVNWQSYDNDPSGLISDYIIPGISGTGGSGEVYSVVNHGQAYLHYTGDITADNESWVGTTTGNTYTDVPVLLLDGAFKVVGTAREGNNLVISDLDQVTIIGDSTFESTRTATNLLNDVSVRNLVNDGSQFHVTGVFEDSIFSVYSGTNNLLNWAAANRSASILNMNDASSLGSQKDGEMFFGRASTNDNANIFHVQNRRETLVDGEYDNRVEFAEDVSYNFTNRARMTIENFMGLGVKEEHAVSIENSGVSAILTIDKAISTEMEVDGRIVQVTDANGNSLKLTDDNDNYTMFVQDRGAETPFKPDPKVRDFGIVNLRGGMTINGVNILNTNANSVAVTNQAGTFNMNGGALIGTYSGFDNIENIVSMPGTVRIDIEIQQGSATLQNIVAVAGTAFGIRNTGNLEFTNENTALITNDLDVTLEKGSAIEALFLPFKDSVLPEVENAIGIANYTIAAAAQVIYIPAHDKQLQPRIDYTVKIHSYHDEPYTAFKGTIFGSEIPPTWTVTLTDPVLGQIGKQVFSGQQHTVPASNYVITHAVYGSAYTNSTATVDNVEFRLSHVELYETIAVLNEATAKVTGITSFENYFDSIHNIGIGEGVIDSSRDIGALTGSTIAKFKKWVGNYNWPNWCVDCNPENTGTFVNLKDGENMARISDAYLSFSCNINASGVENVRGEKLTLEGLNVTDDQGNTVSSGTMTISGAPYRVKGTETFLNLTIISPENETYAIINDSNLLIENTYTLKQDILDEKGNIVFAAGVYSWDEAEAVMQAGGQLVATNAAYISALKGTAIQNNGKLTMINATVKDSVNGIENKSRMYMVNSQLVDNSSWAVINKSGSADILNSTVAFNGNGLDVQGGNVKLVNSILVNDGLLSGENRKSAVLTVDNMGINYRVLGGGSLDVGTFTSNNRTDKGNIVGETRQAKENAADYLAHAKANSNLLASLYTYQGAPDGYFNDAYNAFVLAEGSPALTGGLLVAIKVDGNGHVTSYSSGTDKGALEGTFVPADKDGNSRIPGTEGNIVVGATVPGTPITPPAPPPGPGPGPGPDPEKPTETPSPVVTTAKDVVDDTDGLISLREAIAAALQGDGNVYFNADALLAESGGNASITITLDSALLFDNGINLVVNGEDNLYNNEKVHITIDGSALTTSGVARLSDFAEVIFNDVSFNAGAGFTITESGVSKTIGGVFLVEAGSALTLNGNLTMQGSNMVVRDANGKIKTDENGRVVYTLDRGGIIANFGSVEMAGNIHVLNSQVNEMGAFLFQGGEYSVSEIGDMNSNILIEGMGAYEGSIVAQIGGKTNLINVVARENGLFDASENKVYANELFAITDELVVINTSIYNNISTAIFGLYAPQTAESTETTEDDFNGKVFVVNSSIVDNSIGYQVDEDGKRIFTNNGKPVMNKTTQFFWSEEKGSTEETETSAGEIYVLNSLIANEVDTENDDVEIQVVNSATGEYAQAAFMYDLNGDLVLDAETYVPVIHRETGAGDFGVIAAVYTDLSGETALALRQNSTGLWFDLDQNVLSDYYQQNIKYDDIGEIYVSGNGSHRYVGQSNLTIGAYSAAYADTVLPGSIIVTTTADEMNGNADISLREAVKYAGKLYEQTGVVFTVGFANGLSAQGDVQLDTELKINTAVNIDGGNRIVIGTSESLYESMFSVGGNVSFNNITLDGSNNGGVVTGGILTVNQGGTASLNGAQLLNGSAVGGGAVYNAGTLSVSGSTFANNSAIGDGGTVYNAGTLTVMDSVFSGSSADGFGGAVYNAGSLSISGSTFADNTALLDGGAIYSENSVTVSDSTFVRNYAGYGGVVTGNTGVSISGSTFAENGADNIVVSYGSLSVTDSTFADNVADNIVVSYGSLTVTDSTFRGNNALSGSLLAATGDIRITGGTFSGNTALEHIAVTTGNMTVSGSTISNNVLSAPLSSIVFAGGDMTVSGSTFANNTAGNEGGILDAMGSLNISNSNILNNASGDTLAYAGGDLVVSGSTISGNSPDEVVLAGENITVTGSTISGNTAALAILLGDTVSITSSTISNNTAGRIVRGVDYVFVEESSMSGNKGNYLLSSGGSISVISSTLADTDGTAVIKVMARENVYILNSTVASASANSGTLINGKDVYVVNSIVVSNDTAAVIAGNIYGAYSIMSGNLAFAYSDQVQNNWSYNAAFGTNQLTADGKLVPVSSIAAMRGVFVCYSVNADGTLNVAYSDPYDDELITDGNFYDPMVNQSWTTLTVNSPFNGKVVRYVHEQYITMPGIGAYWSGSYTVDYGPGLNGNFVDSSFNGTLDYYSWNQFEAAVAGMPEGIELGIWGTVSVIGGFSGNIHEGMNSKFRVTERYDIGGMVSGENYIRETVDAVTDDLDGEYFVTPSTAEGVPVIQEAGEAGDGESNALDATLAEISEGIEDIAEKAVSLFRRAEIFKDNFDKALEELLDIKA